MENATVDGWQLAFETNVLGPVLCSKLMIPLMKAAGGGSIVTFGSVDGMLGNPSIPSYSATKGSIIPLTHVMSQELAQYGIRVNAIARAAAANGAPHPMLAGTLMPYTPLGRFAEPAELGRVVGFFASDESSYVTGSVLTVDGGRTAITPGTLPKIHTS